MCISCWASFMSTGEEDEKALAEYLAVAAARPNLPDVHFWLGHLYWKHGDADHAFAELTRQLEIDPGHPEANGEMGAVLVAKDRTAEAIPHLELAIRSKPDLWPAYQQLGQAYATQKNYARAEEILKRALAHDHDGGVHYQLARVLRAEGKSAEAAKALCPGARHQDREIGSHIHRRSSRRRGEAMTRNRILALAVLFFASACSLTAQSRALDDGVRLIREGHFDQALTRLEEAHRLAPRDATIENLLGITETQLNHSEKAAGHYRNAIRLDPSQASPHRNLGFNLLMAKQYGPAESELREASRLNPNDPFAHYYLFLLALATNHDTDALEQASHAGNLIQNDPDAEAGLIEAEIRLGRVDEASSRIKKMEAANSLPQCGSTRLQCFSAGTHSMGRRWAASNGLLCSIRPGRAATTSRSHCSTMDSSPRLPNSCPRFTTSAPQMRTHLCSSAQHSKCRKRCPKP